MSQEGLSARQLVWRIATVALLLIVYRAAFFPVYQHISGAAFLFAIVPCIAAGLLLGIWGAVAAITALGIVDHTLALAVGAEGEVGEPAMFVTGSVKLLLGIGAGWIAQSTRRLRFVNQQMAEEASRRKKSEAMLEQSERRYRALVESLGEGVGLYDERDVCVFSNRALLTTLGKDKDAIVGINFADHFDTLSQSRIEENRAHKTDTTSRYEVSPKDKPDNVLLVTETPLVGDEVEPGGTTAQTLRVVRDLSDRIESERRQRELERQLQRGQALQSLAVLAGGVAHDFNNLLSGIVGNAEFALRRIPRTAPLELTQCVEEIREFAGEAAQLSRQMLAYAGRRSLAVGAVDVNVEVREALKLLHSMIEAQAILRLELSDGIPQIKADRIQLRQVVTNLVLNALEAMSDRGRGTLTIRTELQQVDAKRLSEMGAPEGMTEGAYVTLSVCDTGIGIPVELKDRIFEPFFSTKSPGRGMGLAASVGIVRSHRGWLDLSSEVGQGTTFRLLLPLVQEARQPVRRMTPVDLRPSRSGNILLIDDEVAVRVVTHRLLVDLGQRVITADSGRRGIELFKQHHATIDLVVLDLTMPELSGAEVLQELRRIREDVSVVVTSGFHPSNASDLLALPNVIGFLEKPHSTANLEAIVATMFAN